MSSLPLDWQGRKDDSICSWQLGREVPSERQNVSRGQRIHESHSNGEGQKHWQGFFVASSNSASHGQVVMSNAAGMSHVRKVPRARTNGMRGMGISGLSRARRRKPSERLRLGQRWREGEPRGGLEVDVRKGRGGTEEPEK